MFNNIGPFWNKIDRKTEHSDAHQNVLRNNPDSQSRKKHKKRENEQKDDELATISIDSLYLFLQSSLPKEETGKKLPHITQKQPQNTRARQAANAYEQRSGQQKQTIHQSEHQKQNLSANDINTVHNLMAELKMLKQSGISHLKIQEGRGFLDSLVKAIKRSKIGI